MKCGECLMRDVELVELSADGSCPKCGAYSADPRKPRKVVGPFGVFLDSKDGAPGVWRVAEVVTSSGLWIHHPDAYATENAAEVAARKLSDAHPYAGAPAYARGIESAREVKS